MNSKFLSSLLLCGILLPTVTSLGSGDYIPPTTIPESDDKLSPSSVPKSKIDGARYNLGRNLYLGKVDLPETPINEEKYVVQNKILSVIKEGLPKSVVVKLDEADLAGRLNKKQFDSLRYYLNKRYKQKRRY